MLSLKVYCSLLFIVCVLVDSCMPQASKGQIKPSILHELKDFENLIPKTVIDEIAAKHLITDSEFRHAFKFMTSSQLPQLIQQFQQIPEVIDILKYLGIWEDAKNETLETFTEKPYIVQAAQIESNNYFIDLVLINVGGESVTTTAPTTQKPYSVQNVRNFVLEVLEHLNHNNFATMITEKRVRNPDFNTMYKSLRSAEFRPKVDAALKTKNLTSIVQLLQQHGIDVNVLEPIAFDVLSWGPKAARKHRKHKLRFLLRQNTTNINI